MIISCPHCNQKIIIEKKNCGIFRCGQHKKTGKQIPSHASKETCDKMIYSGDFWGCGKPFRIIKDSNSIEKCDYL